MAKRIQIKKTREGYYYQRQFKFLFWWLPSFIWGNVHYNSITDAKWCYIDG